MTELRSDANEEILIDHAAWDKIFQITDGAAAACMTCSACTAICPWTEMRGEGTGIHDLIRGAQLGLDRQPDLLWLCTACGACESRCPREVDITRVVLGLRQLAWHKRSTPAGLPSVLWGVLTDGNPWGGLPSERAGWARGLELEPHGPESEFLYFTGCTNAYDPRAQRSARSLVEIFRHGGLAFGALGEEEPCCGDPAWSLGNFSFLEYLVDANVQRFGDAGVRKVVSASPHSNYLFSRVYPDQGATFTAAHYTELLAELVDQERLVFPTGKEGHGVRVAYHDPCYLGRKLGVYEDPRRVLAAIPGVELVEFAGNRAEALCCGGGGGRMWQETGAGERFGDLRMAEAQELGVDLVVTACPYCVACFEDGVRAVGAGAPGVFDLAELVAYALADGVASLTRPDRSAARLTG
ncbi:MAG: (Fe-S)-binding protein [Thermaerobacterales bacterium]